jgi:hypothetical protein
MKKITFKELKSLEDQLKVCFERDVLLDEGDSKKAKTYFKHWVKSSRLPEAKKYRDSLASMNIEIYDNFDGTFDRYTVIYKDEPQGHGLYTCRGMSTFPCHPQGFGMISSAMPGRHLGQRIDFSMLPIDCQQLVFSDLNDEVSNELSEAS